MTGESTEEIKAKLDGYFKDLNELGVGLSEEDEAVDDKPTEKKKKKPQYPHDFGLLDIRIARIIRVEDNPWPGAHTYIQNVDIGEDVTRLIISDLQKHYTEQQLLQRMVVVLCNVRSKRKRGLVQEAWMLCGNTGDKMELLTPPRECEEGDQITVEGYPPIPDLREENEPHTVVIKKVLQDIRINSERQAVYRGIPLKVNGKDFLVTDTVCDCPITKTLADKPHH